MVDYRDGAEAHFRVVEKEGRYMVLMELKRDGLVPGGVGKTRWKTSPSHVKELRSSMNTSRMVFEKTWASRFLMDLIKPKV